MTKTLIEDVARAICRLRAAVPQERLEEFCEVAWNEHEAEAKVAIAVVLKKMRERAPSSVI